MASFLYDSFLRDVTTGPIDMDTDSFKVMLCTSSYTPNRATHTKRSDITNEVTGTGYTAGGAAIVFTPALDTSGHKETFTPADVSWTTSTITARYAVIYKSRGGASSADELVALIDFATDQSSSSGTFTLHASAPISLTG